MDNESDGLYDDAEAGLFDDESFEEQNFKNKNKLKDDEEEEYSSEMDEISLD